METILGDDKNETQLKFKGYTIIKLIQIVEEFKPAFSFEAPLSKCISLKFKNIFFLKRYTFFTLYSVPIKTS